MAGLFDKTISKLNSIMNHQVFRQGVISSNIANLDTPGYKAKDASFEDELESSLNMKTTNRKHLRGSHLKGAPSVIDDPYSRIGNDGNTVDIDREMMKLSQNQLLYSASSQIVKAKIEGIKNAIGSIR